MTVQGVGAIAATRNLHPQTRARVPAARRRRRGRVPRRNTGPKPNRYDEAIDRLRLAALRRDAAAAATSETAKPNTPTDDDADYDRR